MSRNIRVILVSLFLLHFFCLLGISSLLPPRVGPDEKFHFALVQHLLREPTNFPVSYERVFADKVGEVSQVVEQPLYYYLLAAMQKIAGLGSLYPELIKQKDDFNLISGRQIIQPLRLFSLLIYSTGLFGLYLLAGLLVREYGARPKAVAFSIAILLFAPGYQLTAVSLSNDVLVLALWPYVVYFALQSYLTRSARLASLATLFLSLLMLAESFALFLAVGIFVLMASDPILEEVRVVLLTRKNFLRLLGPLSAIAFFVFALGTISFNYILYGSISPGIQQVLADFVPEPSECQYLGFFSFFWVGFKQMVASFSGTVTHYQEIYPPQSLVAAMMLISFVLLVLAGLRYWFSYEVSVSRRKGVFFLLLLCILQFVIVYGLNIKWCASKQDTFFHWRLLNPTLQMAFILLTVPLLNRELRKFRPVAVALSSILLVLAYALAAVVLLRPFYYLQRSDEFFISQNLLSSVEQEARALGFKASSDILTGVESTAIKVVDRYLGDYYLLPQEKTFATKLLLPGNCGTLELMLLAKGDSALGLPVVVDLTVETKTGANLYTGQLEIGPRFNTYTTTFELPVFDCKDCYISVRLAQTPALAFSKLLGSPLVSAKIKSVYTRPRCS